MHVYGWWDFDSTSSTMTNTATGQRVQDHGVGKNGNRRITYSDKDLKLDLIATFTKQRPDIRYTNWMLDYTASLNWTRSLWNRQSIPYGAWLRVDECISDALLAWPDGNGDPAPTNRFELRGGWLNGRWNKDWVRQFTRNHQIKPDPDTIDRQNSHEIPLDKLPGPAWSYKNARQVLPQSWERRKPDRGVGELIYPATSKLAKLGKRTPHVIRNDGKAIILPISMNGRWGYGESYRTYLTALYIDEDFAAELTFNSMDGCRISLPVMESSYSGGRIPDALMHATRKRPYSFTDRDGSEKTGELTRTYMSIAMWRRLNNALLDGLSVWPKGTKQVMPADERSRTAMHGIYNLDAMPTAEEAGFELAELSDLKFHEALIGGTVSSGAAYCYMRRETEIPYSRWRAGVFRMFDSLQSDR